MGKRKLRSCTSCGGRHGPPTGKGCTRGLALLEEKNEEMRAETCAASGGCDDGVPECQLGANQDDCLSTAGSEDKEDWEYVTSGQEKVPTGKFEFVKQTQEKIRQGYEIPRRAVNVEDVFDPPREPGVTSFERGMAARMDHMENLMGRVAGVQQAQLERLVHLANHPLHPPPQEATPMASSAAVNTAVNTAVPKPAPKVPEPPMSELEFDGTEDQEWKEFYGIEVWRKEIERRRKNPFDQKVYMSKGEAVEDLEQLMMVAFKTIIQLLDLGQDVRGVAKHGLFMAEKASKHVYEPVAFLKYDECVRERAGRSGPSAFSSVEQEDVIRCFCFDNTKAAKASREGANKKQKQKSGKYCFRFNDTARRKRRRSRHTMCLARRLW